MKLVKKQPNAWVLLGLAVCGVLSAVCYGLLVVPVAALPDHYAAIRLDLLAILRVDPLAHVRLTLAFVILFALYGLGWLAVRRLQGWWAWLLVAASILFSSMALLYLYPFDAADIYDNISHARIFAIHGGNPFVNVTTDYPQDPFYEYPAWSNTPSAYGPGWEYVAGLTARLAGDGLFENIVAFKLLSGGFAWLAALLVGLLMHRAAPERALSAVWLMGMNPLVLYETFGHGHNDMAMAVWIIAAAWALQERRFTLAVLALVLGMLVKFIPALLVPLAVALALLELPTRKAQLRYVGLTGLLAVGLIVLAYAPFWEGPQVLTLERRAGMFTTSLMSIIYHFLEVSQDPKQVQAILSPLAGLATGLFAIWQAERAVNKDGLLWQRFAQASFNTLLFYLLVTILWFHQWYLVWIVGLLAILPPGPLWAAGLLTTAAVLSKPFWLGPILFLWHPVGDDPWLELYLSVGVLGLPWLAVVAALWLEWRGKPVRPRLSGKLFEYARRHKA